MVQETLPTLLVVDDDRPTCLFIRRVLQQAGFDTTAAFTGAEAIQLLKDRRFELIVSDVHLGALGGLDLLRFVNTLERPSAVIFVTGQGSLDDAVRAIQDGAFDYITKPLDLAEMTDELIAKVNRALGHLCSTEKTLTCPVSMPQPFAMVGKSAQIVEVYKSVAKAAMSKCTVLILGESGTGKELVARAIHEKSPRAGRPFIAVNCGALTEQLLESELFGHVRGAFTGAVANKAGLFTEADAGTIFLDEIGDISPALQVKLLRVLQDGEIRPVGSALTHQIDVRVIAATHRDLDQLVREGRFREDLYYRLKVLLVRTPALRNRREDIPELAHYFLAHYRERAGKKIQAIAEEAMALLGAYRWPGNIRELQNAMEHAVTMTSTSILYPEDFPPEVQTAGAVSPTKGATAESATSVAPPPITSLEQMEREHILRALRETGFNRTRAAEVLGVDRTTLYRKAQKLNISLNINDHAQTKTA